MKAFVLILALIVINFLPVFGEGAIDELVNEQEINLDRFDTITIRYRSDKVTLLNSNNNVLVIKEYMSRDNKSFHARVIESGNELIVESGRRPWIGPFFSRAEVYIPVSDKDITIKTSSGRIEANETYYASTMNMDSSSGSISVNNITANKINLNASSGSIHCERASGNTHINANSGNIVFGVIDGDALVKSSSGRIEIKQITGSLNARASSGSIRSEKVNGNANIFSNSGNIIFGAIGGNAVAEASSGRIELGPVNGKVDVTSSSGSIHCTAGENAGDISLRASSGSVTLNIPRDMGFNFSSRVTSGSLRTPFSEKLFSPVSDKNSAQGVIDSPNGSENQERRNINIRTSSGSIRVNWAD